LVAIPLATASNVFFDDAIQINLNGHINLLAAMREIDSVERIIYTSSSFVYGHFKYDPADEKHPTEPIDIYGGTKLSCEILTKAYAKRFGVYYTIIRPSAVYGPTDANRRVSQIFVENALTNKPLQLHGGGKDKVDFTYLTDIAHGFVLAALSPKAKNEIFNITAGKGRSAEEFASILSDLLPDKVKTIIKPADLNRPIRGSLDITKAKKLLDYEPKYQLEEGLKKYLNYIYSTGLFKK
ncbi:NAD-dependent epimerase/dehydratase family protein, partial [Patescibacteria group bacterium]|nr:NAD-dependent epimerase/dehydratase family protein [Patescibacteria group bacterium]